MCGAGTRHPAPGQSSRREPGCGTFSFTIYRSSRLAALDQKTAWLGDLTAGLAASMWAPPKSAATKQLESDLHATAAALVVTRNNKTATTLVNGLQTLASDCNVT